jgi:hypothetical protein
VFNDESAQGDKATIAVEKTIHHESVDDDPIEEKGTDVEQLEVQPKPKSL